MKDADGSSRAAPGAQTDETAKRSDPGGLLSRLLSWTRSSTDTSQGADELPVANMVNGASPGISNLRRMRVEDVAIPKGEIVAVPVETPLPELVALFRDSGFTRLPVFEGTLDMPLGLVHLKDLALQHGFNGVGGDFDLRAMLRPLLFAPPSMPIGVLLQKMQSQRMHMALVIDEYGGTDGLVTIEDLIEQVIGEIEDEHDVEEDEPWTLEGPGSYLAFARAPLEEFEAETGLTFSLPDQDEEVDTLGGLVFLMLGRVPARGEVVRHPSGAEIEILDADPRRVKRLRIRVPNRQRPRAE